MAGYRFPRWVGPLAALMRLHELDPASNLTPYWECLTKPILECAAWGSPDQTQQFERMPNLQHRITRALNYADRLRYRSIDRRDRWIEALVGPTHILPSPIASGNPSSESCYQILAHGISHPVPNLAPAPETTWNRTAIPTLAVGRTLSQEVHEVPHSSAPSIAATAAGAWTASFAHLSLRSSPGIGVVVTLFAR